MIKLTKYQESELRKFIENTGNKYGVNAQPLQYSECLSGLRIGNTHDYIVSFDPSLSEKYYDYVVSLDPLLSENYYMAFAEITSFDEIKSGIEQVMFELAAYDYLAKHLQNYKLQYGFNTDELGQINSCEVYLPNDITHEFSIWFSDSDGCRCDIVGDLDFKEYIIEAHDINATKRLISNYINELIGLKSF